MVVAEAWGSGQWTECDDEHERQRGRERPLADTPGSVELRMGVAVVGARCVLLERTRGVDPWLVVDGGSFEAGGDMVKALKRLQAAMAKAR